MQENIQMIYVLSVIFVGLIILSWLKPKWAFYILLFLIPFHAFLITSLGHFLNLTQFQQQILASWKEVILATLVIKVGWQSFKTKKIPFDILLIDKLIFVLFLLALITIPFLTKDLKIAFLGLRYDFEMFLTYFLVRSFDWSKKEIKNSVIIILISGLLVSIFAILQVWFFPKDFLTLFGYLSISNWEPLNPIPAFQEIGGSGILRIQSFLAGPNQLGSYLLILISIALSGIIFEKRLKYKLFFILCSGFFVLSLFYTYSRAAWVSFLIIFILWTFMWIYWQTGKFSLKLLFFYLILFALAVEILNLKFFEGVFEDVYLKHQGSTIERIEHLLNSVKVIMNHPFGLGIGKAGPASLMFSPGQALITENWYLQIAAELGILGFLTYLLIIWQYLKNLWLAFKKLTGKFGHPLALAGFLSFVGLSIHALFLPTWSDISTTLTFWFLTGIIFKMEASNAQN